MGIRESLEWKTAIVRSEVEYCRKDFEGRSGIPPSDDSPRFEKIRSPETFRSSPRKEDRIDHWSEA